MSSTASTTIPGPRHRGVPREVPPSRMSPGKHVDFSDVRPETTHEFLAAVEGRIAEALDLFLAIADLDQGESFTSAIAAAGHGRLYEAFEAIGEFRPQVSVVLDINVAETAEGGVEISASEAAPNPLREFAPALFKDGTPADCCGRDR